MNNLTEYLNNIFGDGSSGSNVLNYFYDQLYNNFSPDINGYVLAFFIPPDLSGYRVKNGGALYDQSSAGSSYFGSIANLITFAAIDFTPPQNQVNTEQISSRSGAIPYATEVTESEQCSITLVDNSNLDIFMFHHIWVEYIREVLEGVIEPASEYITPGEPNFGAIDYVGSLYIVKYRPDMQTITFVAKCTGIFPQGIPSKELIGTRTTNELTTLPFTYFCTAYREATHLDKNSSNGDHWILSELNDFIFSKFQSVGNTNQLLSSGDSLGGIIPNLEGSNLSSFSQGLSSIGGAISGIVNTASGVVSSVAGIANQGLSIYNQGQSIIQSMGQFVQPNYNSAGQILGGINTITTQSKTVINKISGKAPKFY